MKIKYYASLSGLLLVLAYPTHAAVVSSSFDVDADGWIGIPGEGSVSYVASGGNTGGHIRVADIGSGGGLLGAGAIAPNKFIGNLSLFDNGTLSVDLAAFAGGGQVWSSFGLLRISGVSEVAYLDLAASPPPTGTWQTYSAPLTAGAWGVTAVQWETILSDVTEIAIGTDAFDGPESIGIDNFTISSPVPVPAATWLFLSGMGSLGLFGWQSRQRNSQS